ncbi:MAG: DUF4838 domain-containing protein [Lachnospiraceae bacterium]|nr:DUF4838 domain-containing protein [Lachnospiraceae bacterium]
MMLQIKKLRADHTVDFAAEELKKYLRMMMPDIGEISISYELGAVNGFRLGLLEDFSLLFEGEDAALDDVIHVDTVEDGGILAGSNPRSVLFAVYRFLKQNGCRFLFPGVDGEYIPRKKIAATKYHKLADHRFRGHTTEGDPSLEQVLSYIDYHAKQELNTYGVFGVYSYHRRYYLHRYNEANRTPEPVELSLVEQWKALCEAELTKRGLMVQDGGHEWIQRAVGFEEADRFLYKEGKKKVTQGIIPYLALLKGKRGLNHSDPNLTNVCMSRADVREKIAATVAEYIQRNSHVSHLFFALADGNHNYCECDECKKLRPSDYLVMILNEIDEMLTRKKLDTKILFCAYVDCMFAPVRERLNNPDRFIMMYTPIARSYTSSITEETVIPEPKPFIYNGWEVPKNTEEYLAQFKEWQKVFPGSCMGYEYHYWLHQYRDPGMMQMSRRIYEDTYSLKIMGLDGCMEDGSNKSFFPNGFHSYIYGETLMNRDCDYDEMLADFYYHSYGEDWKQVKNYLERISKAFDHKYMCGEMGENVGTDKEEKTGAEPKATRSFYRPSHAKDLAEVKELAAQAREMVGKHMAMPTRPQTVSWRLLLRHAEYCERLAEIIAEKSLGHNRYAQELYAAFLLDFGKYDVELERYFDFGVAASSLDKVVKKMPAIEL